MVLDYKASEVQNFWKNVCNIQCNLDLVTLFVSAKTVIIRIMSLNRMSLRSKLKNGLCKIVPKSQVVTKFNVTKSRLPCTVYCYFKFYKP